MLIKSTLLSLSLTVMPAGATMASDDAATATLFPLFMQGCVDNLHQTKKGRSILEASGWSRKPLESFNDRGLFANVLFHSFRDDEGAFYLSPDGQHGFVFGPADNDLYPNAKCMLATTMALADPFASWADKTFAGEDHSDQTGKRFGNRWREWKTLELLDNLPACPAITVVVLTSGLRRSGVTTADTQVSVTGFAP